MAEDVISRADALAQGLKFYFLGVPCKRGHIAKRRVSRSDCNQCKMDCDDRRRRANFETHSAVAKARYRRDREKNKEKYRLKYAQDPGIWKKRAAKWRDKDPEYFKAINRAKTSRYRTRKRNNGSEHYTAQDGSDIFKKQRGKCAYCRCRLGTKFHIDHILAVSRGGSNARRNIQILCGTCNRSKAAKDAIDFAQSRGLLL